MRALTAAEAVTAALAHGSLFGAGCAKTVSVDGRRYPTIRVQSTIFACLYGSDPVYCHELVPAINAALAAREPRR